MAEALPDPKFNVPSPQDEEGLFSRNVNGELIPEGTPDKDDLGKPIVVWIDGQKVDTFAAQLKTDAQGNALPDKEGRVARFTTVYDAASKLYGERVREIVPTLCHQPHMPVIAVCRLCMVQPATYDAEKKILTLDFRLRPACQMPVKKDMHIFTREAKKLKDQWPGKYIVDPKADGVRRIAEAVAKMETAASGLSWLLAADHLHPVDKEKTDEKLNDYNELDSLRKRFCSKPDGEMIPMEASPFAAFGRKPANEELKDETSPVFLVDHNACIQCGRCWRACNDVKQNYIIDKTGKGRTARICFDLDEPMGKSNCVQCGECMISCPTSAITFRDNAEVIVCEN